MEIVPGESLRRGLKATTNSDVRITKLHQIVLGRTRYEINLSYN